MSQQFIRVFPCQSYQRMSRITVMLWTYSTPMKILLRTFMDRMLLMVSRCTSEGTNSQERFSGAKRLRSAALTGKERYDFLSTITAKFFHLQMNVLTVLYKYLNRKDSLDAGTLNAEKIYLGRTRANGEDVENHYEDCKELAVSLTDAYVVHAIMQYFGMHSLDAAPTTNFTDLDLDESSSKDQRSEAVVSSVRRFVDNQLLKNAKEYPRFDTSSYPTVEQITLVLSDGTKLTVSTPARQKSSHDLFQKHEMDRLSMPISCWSLACCLRHWI